MKAADTIAAVATATGRAGIGIVRVSGPQVLELIPRIVTGELKPRKATVTPFRDAAGEPIDHGLALHFPAPHSYTGEHVLELHGHGGPVVLKLVLDRCIALGARLAEPGEFTLRAFLNGRLDLAQAEGVIDVIDATTAHAARSAARSLSGAFSNRIRCLVAAITELRALIEATLDFPEEEVDLLDLPQVSARLATIRVDIASVLDTASQGRILREGLHVVLAGRPNVGKSSLLNMLAAEEVAIVTPIPGTTRDTIRETIDLRGVPLHIVDTAGLRESSDVVETEGIRRTYAAIERADIVVQVVDAEEGVTRADLEIDASLPAGLRRIRVMNKVDLVGHAAGKQETPGAVVIWLSARTGAGIDDLRDALLSAVGWHSDAESIFSARERHVLALRSAVGHITDALSARLGLEVIAEELRLAQRELSSITGEFSADDLLGEIFSRFCIGK
jgi:tRNA modification GTPase